MDVQNRDSGIGIVRRSSLFCDSLTIGIVWVCDAVPAWIIAPTSA
jgi:hypothetical protein